MSDDFSWHENALKGIRGPIYESDPMSGWYRQKRKDGTYEPVAYWKDSSTGEQRCHINGRQPDDLRMLEAWPYASRHPITEAAYWHRMDTGEWPDVDASASQAAKGPTLDPATDPVASLKAEIDAAAAGIDAYRVIESDDAAAKAQTLRSALTTLAGKGKKAHKAEKEPFLEGGRQVDAKWFPPIREAETGANDIRAALEKWEDLKRDNARRAEAEAAKAAREAQAAGQPAPPPPAQNTPAPSTQIRGGSGRAASVGTKRVLTAIDLEKCWAKMGGMPEVYNLFLQMAEQNIAAGRFTADDLGAVFEDRASVR